MNLQLGKHHCDRITRFRDARGAKLWRNMQLVQYYMIGRNEDIATTKVRDRTKTIRTRY